MNNFVSIFEELSKLYEDDSQKVEQVEEKVDEACQEELAEAVDDEEVELEIVEDETSTDEIPSEEPLVEDEPRQLILECGNCGAIVLKDEADVAVDEETDLVNHEDECQFCEETKGYRIVGVVAPYDVTDTEAEVEDEALVDKAVEEPVVEI